MYLPSNLGSTKTSYQYIINVGNESAIRKCSYIDTSRY